MPHPRWIYALPFAALTLAALPAQAEEPFGFRVEAETLGEYTSNVQQLPNSAGDFLLRAKLAGQVKYMFPTQTRISGRFQHQWIRYSQLFDFNQSLDLGTLTVSQMLFDRLNLYTGGQLIWVRADTSAAIQRFDKNLMLGATFFQGFGSMDLLYAGYHLDDLMAEISTSAYFGHSLLAGYQHRFLDNLSSLVSYRFLWRDYQGSSVADEGRHLFGLTATYSPWTWLTLEGRGEYVLLSSTDGQRNTNFFSAGLSVVGGF